MNVVYQAYVNIFWCVRRVYKLVSTDYSKPLQTYAPDWLSVVGTLPDGEIKDITDMVRTSFEPHEIITPEDLYQMSGLYGVQTWGYLTKTLEYNEITTDGVVNGL